MPHISLRSQTCFTYSCICIPFMHSPHQTHTHASPNTCKHTSVLASGKGETWHKMLITEISVCHICFKWHSKKKKTKRSPQNKNANQRVSIKNVNQRLSHLCFIIKRSQFTLVHLLPTIYFNESICLSCSHILCCGFTSLPGEWEEDISNFWDSWCSEGSNTNTV